MRLSLLAVGRLKSGPERELVERYRQRIEGRGRKSLEDLLTSAGDISGKRDLADSLGDESSGGRDWPAVEEKKRDWPGG